METAKVTQVGQVNWWTIKFMQLGYSQKNPISVNPGQLLELDTLYFTKSKIYQTHVPISWIKSADLQSFWKCTNAYFPVYYCTINKSDMDVSLSQFCNSLCAGYRLLMRIGCLGVASWSNATKNSLIRLKYSGANLHSQYIPSPFYLYSISLWEAPSIHQGWYANLSGSILNSFCKCYLNPKQHYLAMLKRNHIIQLPMHNKYRTVHLVYLVTVCKDVHRQSNPGFHDHSNSW